MAAGPLILYGCAAHPVDLGGAPPRGHIATQPGRPGVVIAAPHGNSDARTGEIAAEIARRTGFGLVVATGFALEPDTPGRPGRRYQVNRPREGVPGNGPSMEAATEDARRVYEAYERRVREVAQGPLEFYAEIHGNGGHQSAGRIEIATVGVERAHAVQLRELLELIREAHLSADREAPRLEILVEPADTLRYAASGAKRDGILRLPARALHIELPRAARTEWRALYTAILADFLAQAATLRPLR
ncbi:MAG: hypothetical protein HY727_06095 [Candidatus Rokubacteria bacterium]|nr:hypothetical protein [Candidatus Rokubacteria bacterium]